MPHPRLRLAALLALIALAVPQGADARRRHRSRGAQGPLSVLVLDGEEVRVRWIDGDTFAVADGPLARVHVRVAGVNALETFGPVHAWGSWAPEELLAVAHAATSAAAAGRWRCAARGRDRYGRLLASCPDLARALVRDGLAMVFALGAPAPPALLEAQRAAQRAGAGMWAKGVPAVILAGAHSADEPRLGRRGAYDRLVDTRTGVAAARPHRRVYAACEPVCAGEGAGRSCFVYVPYRRRYRDRPACLRSETARPTPP